MKIVLLFLLCGSSVTCEWPKPDIFVNIAYAANFLILCKPDERFVYMKNCSNKKQSPFLWTFHALIIIAIMTLLDFKH